MLWPKFSYIYVALQILIMMAVEGNTAVGAMAGNQSLGMKHSFSNILLKAVSEEHKQGDMSVNLIFSPVSLEIVLAAAGMGAQGETRQQIADAFGESLDLKSMKNRFSSIFEASQNNSYTLRVATRMFVQRNYTLKQNFVNSSLEVFNCGVAEVDFVEEPVLALNSVNGWVEENTGGLIKNLLSEDAITSDTRLVLANAVYFKGKWAQPFDKANTRKDKFNIAGGQQVDVDMMFVEKKFRYGYSRDLKAQVLELPYEGNRLSMVVLLPSLESSVEELETKISAADFDLSELITNHTSRREVMVHLPKFKLELTTNLENILAKLGMTTMFTDVADFSGITSSPEGLKVSKVVQKAFIEVSEEGTEAAAATGMVMVTRYSVQVVSRETFRADRPFIFYIAEKNHGTTIFGGQCVKFNPH
ncbi:leukocyte elastase inhibitor-like isoform X3 [Hetaerina americana]|uniref:leukocyte elastase inhibitor-like isoform X3 n=1 Tax=Hetaerina americana TaxID=62018 RepID=UPI003A7F13D9